MLKENYKFILKLGLILFLIVSVSTLALSLVNYITEDIIIQKNIELQNEARKNVMNLADDFKKLENYHPKNPIVGDVYAGLKNDKIIGYCINVSPNGYGGKIDMIVGVDENGIVTGVNITSMSETAGLGARASEPSFLNGFKGKRFGVSVNKNALKDGNIISAISGATITSKAVTEGVNLAISEVTSVKESAK